MISDDSALVWINGELESVPPLKELVSGEFEDVQMLRDWRGFKFTNIGASTMAVSTTTPNLTSANTNTITVTASTALAVASASIQPIRYTIMILTKWCSVSVYRQRVHRLF